MFLGQRIESPNSMSIRIEDDGLSFYFIFFHFSFIFSYLLFLFIERVQDKEDKSVTQSQKSHAHVIQRRVWKVLEQDKVIPHSNGMLAL